VSKGIICLASASWQLCVFSAMALSAFQQSTTCNEKGDCQICQALNSKWRHGSLFRKMSHFLLRLRMQSEELLGSDTEVVCIGSWIVAMLWECHASVIPSVIPSVMPCLRTWNLLMLLLSGAYRLNAKAPDSPPRSPEWRVATWMACHVATIRAMPCRACVCS